MTTMDTISTGPPDFADLYAEHLDRVWRFVRSRVPDHHEAQDVTSDVFVRAWRSWDRFDPTRGHVAPWLYTIAHRAVADWWRRRGPLVDELHAELPDDAVDPEQDLLRVEVLGRLASALAGLSGRERDGLALRFAARLSMEHVAQVLGTSTGAAKMMLHRAIRRLAQDGLPVDAADEPADLEAIIDDVLVRGSAAIGDSDLHALLVRMTALHQHDVPDDLPTHVADCVACAALDDDGEDDVGGGDAGRAPGTARPRARVGNMFALLLAFAGVCLVCALPALQTLTLALGVGMASYVVHLVGVAAVPLVAYLVYRGVRRHGRARGWRLARVGAVVMGLHAILHVAYVVLEDVAVPGWVDVTGTITWAGTDWVGTALLVSGAFLNVVDTQRWRQREAARFRAAVA